MYTYSRWIIGIIIILAIVILGIVMDIEKEIKKLLPRIYKDIKGREPSTLNRKNMSSTSEWSCKICGRSNNSYVGTCACGYSKISQYNVEKKEEVKNKNWVCRTCGKINPNYTGTCSCGSNKP